MKNKGEKKKIEREIIGLFNSVNSKTSQREIKRIKKLAMHYNIKLGKSKRNFCKKCFSVFNSASSRKRLNKGKLIITCLRCGNVQRYGYK